MDLTLTDFIILGVLVEATGESLWWVFDGKWSKERIMALVLGVLFAAVTGLNLLDAVGLTPAEYLPPIVWMVVGIASTAMVAMRGATAVHDLLKLVEAWRGQSAVLVTVPDASPSTSVLVTVPATDKEAGGPDDKK